MLKGRRNESQNRIVVGETNVPVEIREVESTSRELGGYNASGKVITSSDFGSTSSSTEGGEVFEVPSDLNGAWGYDESGRLVTIREEAGLLPVRRRTRRSSGTRTSSRGSSRRSTSRSRSTAGARSGSRRASSRSSSRTRSR